MTIPTKTKAHEIIEATAALYGIHPASLTAGCRTNDVVERADARHLAMWLIRRHCGYSLPRIGRLFGGRHHTTVLHAIRKVDAATAKPGIAEQIGEFERRLFA